MNILNKKFFVICLLLVSSCAVAACAIFAFNFFNKYAAADIDFKLNENALEFVYIDSPQLNVGDTQQVFVSYSDEQNAYKSQLIYHIEGEEQQRVAPTAVIEGVAKYEIPCMNDSSVGKYTLDCVSWLGPEDGHQKIECNPERGYSFSVSKPIESLDNNDLADVYKINADGSFEKADSFSDAVNNGDAQMMFGSDAANLNSANSNLVIALDAGHGGSDPGACGSGLRESDINLKIATACYNKLREFSGCTPYMVRSYDVTVGLEERVNRAVGVGANVFVSFHINAGGGTGYEVWVQNSSSYLYNLHNESDGLASVIRAKLARFGWYDRGSKERDYPQDGSWESTYPDGSVADYLSVLRNSRRHGMPAVLIEHGFIDNPNDVARLADDNFLTALGIADAEAIAEFYNIGRYEIVNGTYEIELAGDNSIVLDVAGQSSADKSKIITARRDDKKLTQRWRVVTDPNTGNAVFLNVANNKALDLIDGLAIARNGIQLLTFNDQSRQKWHFFKVDGSDDTFNISTSCNDGMYIDIENGSRTPGAKVQIYNNNGSIAQRFRLKKMDNTDEAVELNGTFKISTKLDSKKVLDVKDASSESGAPVQIYDNNDSIAQKWHIWTDPDTKLVTIVSCCSGHVLDVQGGYLGPNACLQQYSGNYTLAQQWKIVSVSGGGYRFMSANNENLAMDVIAAQTTCGTRLWTYYMTGANSEVFYLTDCHVDVPGSNFDIDETNYYKINSALNNNKALDVSNASTLDGAPLDIYQSKGADDFNKAQIFKFESVNKTVKEKTGKYYRITNVYSNKTVSAGNGQWIEGTGVKQAYTNSFNDERQLWAAYNVDGKVKLKNLASGLYLDVDGGIAKDFQKVEMNSEKSINSQKWSLLKVTPRQGEDIKGTFYITMSLNNNYVLDVLNGSKDLMANVQIYEANGSNAQKWQITTNDGLSLIKNVGSGKYLNVANGTAYSGCNVWQYTNDGSNACYWKFIKNSSGNYEIVSALNDFYSLDAASGVAANGTNVQIFSTGDSAGEAFKLTDASGKHGEQVNGDFIIGSSLNYSSVVDVNGASKSSGANVQVYQSNCTGAQKWHVETDAKGIATIKNLNSGLYLDVNCASTTSGTNVQQYSWNGTNAQKWKFISTGNDGEYEIVSALNDFVTLDIAGSSIANGTNIQIYKCNGTNAQRFNLFNLNQYIKKSDTVDSTTYRIYPSCNSGYSLDLSGGSTYNGGNIQIWAYDSTTPNQVFALENAGDFYYIRCLPSGKYLDVDSGCPVPGTNVQQWDLGVGKRNQMWAFYRQPDGSYIIMNAASGLVLDINTGVLCSGQNVQGYKQNNTAAQLWSMAHIDPSTVFYPIMQLQTHSAQQMVNLFNSYHKTYPAVYASKGAKTIDEWCNIAVEEANYEGVDPSVLFAQAMYETGWLQFGGDVRPEQCNFGGLGAVGGGAGGASFNDVREGLRAQVQHLKGYASVENLRNPIVDPRWGDLIKQWGRGSAPYLELLNGKWAVPGDGYGQAIRSIINRL